MTVLRFFQPYCSNVIASAVATNNLLSHSLSTKGLNLTLTKLESQVLLADGQVVVFGGIPT